MAGNLTGITEQRASLGSPREQGAPAGPPAQPGRQGITPPPRSAPLRADYSQGRQEPGGSSRARLRPATPGGRSRAAGEAEPCVVPRNSCHGPGPCYARCCTNTDQKDYPCP
ncbi:unnamed protein product [Eretmochelys imbricata]